MFAGSSVLLPDALFPAASVAAPVVRWQGYSVRSVPEEDVARKGRQRKDLYYDLRD